MLFALNHELPRPNQRLGDRLPVSTAKASSNNVPIDLT
ncbi:hypothetical protein M595_4161 [Lyngbya aestuarii BL J]|uniref:Uncharacterized protein n=1 Tax=Lyngbya aestuarii BL J TaxID=1348334 RepID=U7QHE4_9CYAN|nr:hypothetical protein M595_4161 [Lyngbya aestuarii BL J]